MGRCGNMKEDDDGAEATCMEVGDGENAIISFIQRLETHLFFYGIGCLDELSLAVVRKRHVLSG